MVVFIVRWPCLLTTKLSCLQKNKSGQTNIYVHALSSRHNFKIGAWLQKQNLGYFCAFLPPKQKSNGVFTANSEF